MGFSFGDIIEKVKSLRPGKGLGKDPNNVNTVPEGNTKTINKGPIFVIIFIILIFVAVISYVASSRNTESTKKEEEDKNKGKLTVPASARVQKGQFILPSKEEILDTQKKEAEKEKPKEEIKTIKTPDKPIKRGPSEYERQIWNKKLQLLQTGIHAKTEVPEMRRMAQQSRSGQQAYSGGANGSFQGNSNDPNIVYQRRVAELERNAGNSGAGIMSSSLMGGGNRLADAGRMQSLSRSSPSNSSVDGVYGTYNRKNRWNLGNKLENPNGKYEIRAGFIIPAIMLSGINSDLPGQVIGQVSQNVYDSATGKYLLIPQGTRLIGMYDSGVMFGQSRVLMAWQRLIFPDGRALDIGSMPGTDSSGYSGFEDQVNNHYFRVFGSALMLSGVIAAIDLSQNKANENNKTDAAKAGDSISQALGQTLGNTISQFLQKNMSIAPTLEIRPGYRFNVMVVRDIQFDKPYKFMEY